MRLETSGQLLELQEYMQIARKFGADFCNNNHAYECRAGRDTEPLQKQQPCRIRRQSVERSFSSEGRQGLNATLRARNRRLPLLALLTMSSLWAHLAELGKAGCEHLVPDAPSHWAMISKRVFK